MRALLPVIGIVLAGIATAQFGRDWRDRGRNRFDDFAGGRPPRNGVPDWQVKPHMPGDVFTFVRVRYRSEGRGGWSVDYPDSDLNFSYRLQELTSLEVDPDGKVLELTDPELFDHPFIYMIEPGSIYLSEEERSALRTYLENGGFLMVDDFWGWEEREGFLREFRRVFPDRNVDEELVDLTLDDPIFSCVFKLKEIPQVPSIDNALRGRNNGVTWETRKPGSRQATYSTLRDAKGRMMCIICWNTDLGDGWEREGENEWYFREFSEKKSYPMGVNIVFWALTH